jgi:hypothetical protein
VLAGFVALPLAATVAVLRRRAPGLRSLERRSEAARSRPTGVAGATSAGRE